MLTIAIYNLIAGEGSIYTFINSTVEDGLRLAYNKYTDEDIPENYVELDDIIEYFADQDLAVFFKEE